MCAPVYHKRRLDVWAVAGVEILRDTFGWCFGWLGNILCLGFGLLAHRDLLRWERALRAVFQFEVDLGQWPA